MKTICGLVLMIVSACACSVTSGNIRFFLDDEISDYNNSIDKETRHVEAISMKSLYDYKNVIYCFDVSEVLLMQVATDKKILHNYMKAINLEDDQKNSVALAGESVLYVVGKRTISAIPLKDLHYKNIADGISDINAWEKVGDYALEIPARNKLIEINLKSKKDVKVFRNVLYVTYLDNSIYSYEYSSGSFQISRLYVGENIFLLNIDNEGSEGCVLDITRDGLLKLYDLELGFKNARIQSNLPKNFVGMASKNIHIWVNASYTVIMAEENLSIKPSINPNGYNLNYLIYKDLDISRPYLTGEAINGKVLTDRNGVDGLILRNMKYTLLLLNERGLPSDIFKLKKLDEELEVAGVSYAIICDTYNRKLLIFNGYDKLYSYSFCGELMAINEVRNGRVWKNQLVFFDDTNIYAFDNNQKKVILYTIMAPLKISRAFFERNQFTNVQAVIIESNIYPDYE